MDYCSYFNLNSFSPVMEGYRQHFNEILLILAGFTAKYQRFRPKKPLRNRYSLKNKRQLELTPMHKLLRAMNTKSEAIAYVNRKRMKMANVFYLPKHFVPHDEYQPQHMDGGMDDATFGKMSGGEFIRERLMQKNYVRFV